MMFNKGRYVLIQTLRRLNMFNWLRDMRNRFKIADQSSARFFRQFIKEGDLVFDVGANIGQMADIFLQCKASVVMLEPQPQCARYLQRKYARHPAVTVIPKAVSYQTGTAAIMISSANALSTLSPQWPEALQKCGRHPGVTWEDRVTVTTVTLDELVSEFGIPAFCKVDIEGYEWPAVKGLTRALPMMSLEICPENRENILAALEHLLSIGASACQHSFDTRQWNLSQWMTCREFIAKLRDDAAWCAFGDIYVRSEARE